MVIKNQNMFLFGFLVRLIYGLFAIPVLVIMTWIKPEVAQHLGTAILFYIGVCLAGGIYDAVSGKGQTALVIKKPGPKDYIEILLSLAFLFLLLMTL